jgi:hypothetical protein
MTISDINLNIQNIKTYTFITWTVTLHWDQKRSLIYSALTDITVCILLEVLHFSLIYTLTKTNVPVFWEKTL